MDHPDDFQRLKVETSLTLCRFEKMEKKMKVWKKIKGTRWHLIEEDV
jgi:hypothetical protein